MVDFLPVAELTWLRFIVFLTLAAALIYGATKLSGRTLASILGIGVTCILLLLVSWFGLRRPSQVQTQSDWTAYPRLSSLPNQVASSKPAISNEALWDRLTQSKINLEAEPAESSQAISEDSKPELSVSNEVEKEEQEKPEWVDWPPKRVGNVYRQVIVSERYSTVDECYANLEKRFQEVVRVRLQRLCDGLPGSPFAIPQPARMGIGLDYIMSEICREDWIETVSSSVGDMKRVHVLMEFDSAIDNHLRTSWQRYERLSRLVTVGGIASLALGGLALVFGLLKFDTWTRGYYTKRLLIGVPAAIIVLVLLFAS